MIKRVNHKSKRILIPLMVFNITAFMTANLLLFGILGVNLMYNPIMFSIWFDVYIQWAAALLAFVVYRHIEHKFFYLG
eukprot:CAMPEP_0184355444 /NCGR_PEP_ID=MMETSP1089-20130417/96045_1 /TAXON_ID=38269 ORGANISM="Gloeochaete wittrockiana, Strain SAG46.84" /NCGR_SAMPLE_ID=MMETSP1089 /ASSEMBLY_ACC=CAM_ASM_000445 /LENGTH=77 /DNA_ID=CAMNT_0026692107 /DNA_START=33 /DNA_END=262 /DNA_ORIENTATION=-